MKIDETELQKLAEKLRAAIAPLRSDIAAAQAMRAANETSTSNRKGYSTNVES
jgi:hypothetical protein